MLINKIIDDKGLTKAELARRLGWSPQALHSRLKNNNPTYDTILQIAKALECEVQELFPVSQRFYHLYIDGEWLGIRKK